MLLPRFKRCAIAALALWGQVECTCAHAAASLTQQTASQIASLADLDIEELGNIRVTSVSKQPERLADAPASIFVITAEDIRRSGASNLPEVLRLAPNLEVAWISNGQYAIGARGFNGFRSNKLLVLMDGHALYSPTSAIVYWDQLMVMLEDVDRIEVISGPGGTLWGLNAVNGIINIVTRHSSETTGALVSAGAGSRGHEGAFRYGGSVGQDKGDARDAAEPSHFRVFGQHLDRHDSSTRDGRPIDDGFAQSQVGMRMDGQASRDTWSVVGNLFQVQADQPLPGFFALPHSTAIPQTLQRNGLALTSKWARQLSSDSNVELQAYIDHNRRNIPAVLDDDADTFDLQAQHALQAAEDHRLVWGGEYRQARNKITPSAAVTFVPDSVKQTWSSLFAQDEWALRPTLHWTLGARVETNPYTHPDFLPSTRLAWNVAASHLLWAAASRAVRSPSRVDMDLRFPATPPYLQSGSSDFRAEVATVYEIGYRGQLNEWLSSSLTFFQSHYEHLLTLERGPTGNVFANNRQAITHGVEWWGNLQASAGWRLSGGLSTLNKDLRLTPGTVDLGVGTGRNGNDPSVSWRLRSSHTLSDQWDFDATLRRVSSLPNPYIKGYVVADLRLSWKPRPGLEVSLLGNNWLRGKHEEFALTNVVNPSAAVSPSVGVNIVSRF